MRMFFIPKPMIQAMTDSGISQEYADEIRQRGIQLIIAK